PAPARRQSHAAMSPHEPEPSWQPPFGRESIISPVAEEIDREDDQEDHQSGEEPLPPQPFVDEAALSLLQKPSPGGLRRLKPQAEERQRRLGKYRRGYAKGRRHDDRAHGVRQNMS